MGPTKLVLPLNPAQPPPGPILVAAHELLDQLYEETVRLLREKEPALHHLAKSLIERDEIIGQDLEDVFAEVEERHPELRQPFQRRILRFRAFAPAPERDEKAWTPPASQEQAPAARDGQRMDPAATPPWATTRRT